MLVHTTRISIAAAPTLVVVVGVVTLEVCHMLAGTGSMNVRPIPGATEHDRGPEI